MPTLFSDEQIVSSSDGDRVVLTTHRICYEHQEWGRSYNQSIMLEHITSCENNSVNKYWLLIIAGFLVFFGFFTAANGNLVALVVCGLIAVGLIVLHGFSRENLIVIGSPSTKMRINVTGMDKAKVLSFVNKIEQTKHERLLTLNNKN